MGSRGVLWSVVWVWGGGGWWEVVAVFGSPCSMFHVAILLPAMYIEVCK